jgi:hypothetical protein
MIVGDNCWGRRHMADLLGFELDLWDYLTFLTLFILGAAFLVGLVIMAGLPGKIAIARKHPDAEAVKMMGWAGFLAVVPWIQAFIWAFKPTDIIDIRRFPAAEHEAIEEDIARLRGDEPAAPSNEKPAAPPSDDSSHSKAEDV